MHFNNTTTCVDLAGPVTLIGDLLQKHVENASVNLYKKRVFCLGSIEDVGGYYSFLHSDRLHKPIGYKIDIVVGLGVWYNYG